MDTSEHRDLRGGEIVEFPDPPLIQRLEEAFGVVLPDSDLDTAKTVDDLYRLILIELKTQPTPSPAIPFHRLRQALQSGSSRKHAALRPSTRLASIFPIVSRTEEWKHLAALTALDLPPLRPFRWLRDAIRIATGLAAVGVFVGMVLFTRPSGLLWFPPLLVSVFAGLITYRSLFVATQPLVLEFPVRTLGELAQDLVERSPELFVERTITPLSSEQVWAQLLRIVGQAYPSDGKPATSAEG